MQYLGNFSKVVGFLVYFLIYMKGGILMDNNNSNSQNLIKQVNASMRNAGRKTAGLFSLKGKGKAIKLLVAKKALLLLLIALKYLIVVIIASSVFLSAAYFIYNFYYSNTGNELQYDRGDSNILTESEDGIRTVENLMDLSEENRESLVYFSLLSEMSVSKYYNGAFTVDEEIRDYYHRENESKIPFHILLSVSKFLYGQESQDFMTYPEQLITPIPYKANDELNNLRLHNLFKNKEDDSQSQETSHSPILSDGLSESGARNPLDKTHSFVDYGLGSIINYEQEERIEYDKIEIEDFDIVIQTTRRITDSILSDLLGREHTHTYRTRTLSSERELERIKEEIEENNESLSSPQSDGWMEISYFPRGATIQTQGLNQTPLFEVGDVRESFYDFIMSREDQLAIHIYNKIFDSNPGNRHSQNNKLQIRWNEELFINALNDNVLSENDLYTQVPNIERIIGQNPQLEYFYSKANENKEKTQIFNKLLLKTLYPRKIIGGEIDSSLVVGFNSNIDNKDEAEIEEIHVIKDALTFAGRKSYEYEPNDFEIDNTRTTDSITYDEYSYTEYGWYNRRVVSRDDDGNITGSRNVPILTRDQRTIPLNTNVATFKKEQIPTIKNEESVNIEYNYLETYLENYTAYIPVGHTSTRRDLSGTLNVNFNIGSQSNNSILTDLEERLERMFEEKNKSITQNMNHTQVDPNLILAIMAYEIENNLLSRDVLNDQNIFENSFERKKEGMEGLMEFYNDGTDLDRINLELKALMGRRMGDYNFYEIKEKGGDITWQYLFWINYLPENSQEYLLNILSFYNGDRFNILNDLGTNDEIDGSSLWQRIVSRFGGMGSSDDIITPENPTILYASRFDSLREDLNIDSEDEDEVLFIRQDKRVLRQNNDFDLMLHMIRGYEHRKNWRDLDDSYQIAFINVRRSPVIQRFQYITDGVEVDNIEEYRITSPIYQYDSRWAHIPFRGVSGSDSTIASAGCVPVTFSMALMHHNKVSSLNSFSSGISFVGHESSISNVNNPDRAVLLSVRYALEKGYRVDVTYGPAFFRSVSEYANINQQTVYPATARNNPELLIEHLQDGKLIAASMGQGTFTRGSHLILLSGITEDGLIIVNDPNSIQRSNVGWSLGLILDETDNGFYLFD